MALACARHARQISLTVETRDSDGDIVAGIPVEIGGQPAGESDHRGVFTHSLKGKPGQTIRIRANPHPDSGYLPWETTVVIPAEAVSTLRLTAVLIHMPDIADTAPPDAPQFVVIVQENGAAVSGADIYLDRHHAGTTDAAGAFRHPMDSSRSLAVMVDKPGLARWKRTLDAAPGKQVIVNLSEAHRFDWSVRENVYGEYHPIAGARLWVDGEVVGVTDDYGELFYDHADIDDQEIEVVIEADGVLPKRRKGKVTVSPRGSFDIRFAAVTAPRPRIGLLPVQLADDAGAESVPIALVQAFRYGLETASFVEVVPIDPLALQGEEKLQTPSMSELDGLAVLSVESAVGGYTLEATLLSSQGEMALAAMRTGIAPDEAPEIATAVGRELVDAYPVEGAVRAVAASGVLTNLKGVNEGDVFDVYKAMAIDGARWKPNEDAERKVGKLRVERFDAHGAVMRPVGTLDMPLAIGDRLVRVVSEPRATTQMLYVQEAAPSTEPASGVHVYLGGVWAGATDGDGIARVQAVPGQRYTVLLYKRGYPPVSEEVVFGTQTATLRLAEEGALRVEGKPAGAHVRVDGIVVGRLPMSEAVPVPPGLRRVQVSAPGYLSWERTLRMGGEAVELTGDEAVELRPDVLARGAEREAAGAFEAASHAYAQAGPDHPDYVVARTRRAQLLLESLQKPDAACSELLRLVDLDTQPTHDPQDLARRMLLAKALSRRAENASSPYAAASDLQQAAAVLSAVVASTEPGTQQTRALYSRALALHHLHTLGPTAATRQRALEAWRAFLDAPDASSSELATARRLVEELDGWDEIN